MSTIRTANHTATSRCRSCDDEALVIVALRVDTAMRGNRFVEGGPFEELAPCPHCEKGYRAEFGLGRRRKFHNDGTFDWEEYQSERPPWGTDGYWQGKSVGEVQPAAHRVSMPISPAENARRMRELIGPLVGALPVMPDDTTTIPAFTPGGGAT